MSFSHICPVAREEREFFKSYPELDIWALQLQKKVKDSLNTSKEAIWFSAIALSWALKADNLSFPLFMLSGAS